MAAAPPFGEGINEFRVPPRGKASYIAAKELMDQAEKLRNTESVMSLSLP